MITSYNDLPIGKYLDILALDKDALSDVDYQVEVVCILNDLSTDEVLDLPLPQYKELADEAGFLTAPVLKNGRTLFDGKRVAKTYTLAGLTLDVCLDAAKMTAAQYIDFQNYSRADGHKHLPELLSCVMIPRGCKYNEGYDITDVHRAIRENLSVADCYALSAFFLRAFVKSTVNTLYSLHWELMRKRNKTEAEKKVLKKIQNLIRSQKSGAGLQTLMQSLNSLAVPGPLSGR